MVSGAGAGLGRAVSLELVQRGASVACIDIDASRANCVATELRERDGNALAVPADVASQCDCDQAIDTVRAWRGDVDVLVNNAAISIRKQAIETSLDEIRRLFDVNFFGPIYLTLGVLPSMLDRERGSIVSVTSVVGYVPNPLEAAYGASKAALSRWSHGLSVELRGTGVDASVISPGPMDTEMWLSDEQPSPYSGRLYPPARVAHILVDVVERGTVHRSAPLHFGAVSVGYPLCGPLIRWGLRRFAGLQQMPELVRVPASTLRPQPKHDRARG